jgi:hypothetical protein
MKQVFVSALVLCCISLTAVAQSAGIYSSYLSGNRYDFKISAEQLARTPVWADDQDNPPLSPRAALKIGKAQLVKIFPDADQWTNFNLELHRVSDRWIYLISFTEPAPQDAMEHFTSPFRLPVLMNGDTIEPEISAWKN